MPSFSAILPFDTIGGGFDFVDQIWVKYIEFVALHDFWWGIVMVIMSLVVLIPLIAHLHAVEVTRLSWPILVRPLRFG